MLRYAAAASARTRTTVADTTMRGISHISKAAYHHKSPHGNCVGGGKWSAKLLQYVQSSIRAFFGPSVSSQRAAADTAARSFMRTAAGKLAARAPRIMAKGTSTATRLATTQTHLQSLFKQFSRKLTAIPGVSRFAGRAINPRIWAFGSGGKWYPYLRTITQSMRSLSGPKNIASARIIMAQLQRQVLVAGGFSQQRRDLSSVSPLAQGTKISMLSTARAQLSPAATKFVKKESNSKMTSAAQAAGNNSGNRKGENAVVKEEELEQMHPIAKAAQEIASVPVDQCVTITIPYTISSTSLATAANGQQQAPFSSSPLTNVAQLISDVQRVQQLHSLLLSRLAEKLASTGWSIQYHHVSMPTESIQIALPPSSGIYTAADLEALLCDWGFDINLFAATVRDPVSPPAEKKPAAAAATTTANRYGMTAGHSMSNNRSFASTNESEDIDSRLFSLIVDQVVDPEEAYREEVRDFLAQIEQMPRLKHATSLSKAAPYVYVNGSAGNASLTRRKRPQTAYPFLM